MLPELAEPDATGEFARIYEEIRVLCAVPYVSSMQRHLATRPGWLEWVWAAVRPAFADGSAQTAAWRIADALEVPPLPKLTRDELAALGVDAAAEGSIRTICESFIRVSPTNLMFAGNLRRLLAGERPDGDAAEAPNRAGDWTPPTALPRSPAPVDLDSLSADRQALLMRFSKNLGDETFVPGLYTMLANWPDYFTHLAELLLPKFEDPDVTGCCDALAQDIDAAVPAVFARLPGLGETPPEPPEAEFGEILTALESYRATSPQMVVFSMLIRDALPAD